MLLRLLVPISLQLVLILHSDKTAVPPPAYDRTATVKPKHFQEDIDKVAHSLSTKPITYKTVPQTASVGDNDCGLTLQLSETGCYSVSGISKVTISAEIGWSTIPDGGVVTVQLGSATKTFTTRAISTAANADVHTPQVVAFQVDADGTPAAVTVSYNAGGQNCSVTETITKPSACPPLTCLGLGGTVFKDFNADGIHQDGEATGLPDITVRAITRVGTTYTTSTDSIGNYTMAIPQAEYPVRIEFTNIPTYAGNGTPNGADGRTTVQFVSAPDCRVDLGVLNAQEYCQTDPLIMLPCFVNGDPLPNGSTSGGLDALIAFPYSSRGNKNMSVMKPLATASQVGSLWGTTYSKFTKRLYTSAVLRRHVGLGPAGLGGIYITDMSGPTLSTANTNLYVDLTTLGIDLGTIPSNNARGLEGLPIAASHDPDSFTAIGKVGIGDMDIAEDGSLLWFTNLHDGKLYSLRVPPSGAPGPSDWAVHPLPADNVCTSGIRRIWALKTYQGKVYVGAVCDASVSKDKSDLRAIVYAYTPGTGDNLGSGGTYQIIFDFPLTYPKGAPDRTDFSIRGWYPWEDSFSNFVVVNTGEYFIMHPQPILASIEFDIDGSMVLGFNDRSGLQLGFQNFSDDAGDTKHYSNISGGDLLRAYFSNGTFILENGGKAGPNTGSSINNNQGPGGGEFYNDDFYYEGQGLVHSENANGALAIRPGSGEVVASTMDPLNNQSWSGGLRFLSNKTGTHTTGNNATSAFVVYKTVDGDGGTLGKATGLGGVGLACDLPAYLQVGNRVWLDTDHDGEQDPDEAGLPGVNVSLLQNGVVLATTTTDAVGEYYFTYTPTSSTVPGSTTALLPNSSYQIVFGTNGQFVDTLLTAGGGKYHLTVANATGGYRNDLNDSDAQLTAFASFTAPAISITTSYSGSVDHSFDVGFYCLPTSVASVSVTPATCPVSSITANSDARIDISGIQNGDKTFLYTTSIPPAYTATGNSRTIVSGSVSYTGLANPVSSSGTSYSVIVYNGPYCYEIVPAFLPYNNCIPTVGLAVTPGTCNTLTNEYTLTGTMSLSNSITDNALLTDGNVTASVPITVGSTSVPFSLSGFPSGSGPHSLSASYAGQVFSLTYSAPSSCTVAADIQVTLAVVCAGQPATLTASGCATGRIDWSAGTMPSSGTSVTVSTASLASIASPTVLTYTATCTIGNSVTSAVASVTVNPLPTATVNSATICTGQSATLLATGGTSYTLLPDNLVSAIGEFVVSPTSQSAYTVIVSNANGCVASVTGTVSVNELPVATLTSATICSGQTASLTATGGNSYTLLPGNLVNASGVFVVTPTGNTVYTAVVGTSSGCTATTIGAVTVNPLPTIGNIYSNCNGPGSYTIVLDNVSTTTAGPLTYELVQGSSFDTGVAVTSGKTLLPATGFLSPIQSPGIYWLRVYNETDCYAETSVDIQACVCPTGTCVPILIKIAKRPGR
ncbi:SdrD B-like domain-containing protein [Spirosoma panaciterrae]|uniref:SdrD B-like domain-containing protein n=1 Tax=Spirosoma panaciterrae TaxID=496058 RepID=UPI00037B75E2|nr:SdrD B-like domain-containing protein [Spirosoma panaciterrae]